MSEYRPSITYSGICSRCLSNSHERRNCRAPIKCHACLHWGHVQLDCPVKKQQGSNSRQLTGAINGKAPIKQPTTFAAPPGSGPSKPPTFVSSDWDKQHLHLNAEQQVIEWSLLPKSMTDGLQLNLPHLEENTAVSLDLNLNLDPSPPSSTMFILP